MDSLSFCGERMCIRDRVKLDDRFHCPGYKMVEDRKIRCHKVGGHGSETFVQGIQNSCNPVFIEIGLRLGTDDFYKYFEQFGLMGETGVDLPGEASTIMHKKENVGQVELATMSFGQSFQVTPVQMAATVSSLINGGYRVTPHFGVQVLDAKGKKIETLHEGRGKRTVSYTHLLLCYNCKKKFKVPQQNKEAEPEQKYSNIPPKKVREKRETEMRKAYDDLLSIEDEKKKKKAAPKPKKRQDYDDYDD